MKWVIANICAAYPGFGTYSELEQMPIDKVMEINELAKRISREQEEAYKKKS